MPSQSDLCRHALSLLRCRDPGLGLGTALHGIKSHSNPGLHSRKD